MTQWYYKTILINYKNGLSFNYSKCKSIHFGRNNPENVYTMKLEDNEIHQIEKTELERDLGILISNDLKWENQVNKAAKTANFVFAQIKFGTRI